MFLLQNNALKQLGILSIALSCPGLLPSNKYSCIPQYVCQSHILHMSCIIRNEECERDRWGFKIKTKQDKNHDLPEKLPAVKTCLFSQLCVVVTLQM